TSNKTKFKWDDQLADYAKGDLDNFQHEEITDRDDLDLTTTTKPRDFDVRRLSPNVVSQTMKSGDCSIFVVKYLECLLADFPISNIVHDVMQHLRDKLRIDLFYQDLEP
ncbi:Ulp1 protease family, C-terminal catalytic domain containing protein, partial [Parasponia andersonii]